MSEKKEDVKQENYLILELSKPVTYEQMEVTRIDLTKLQDMTLDELSDTYDIYEAMGGKEGVMQEFSTKFVKILAHQITGYPMELIGKISAKDCVRLKARVYRFFYL